MSSRRSVEPSGAAIAPAEGRSIAAVGPAGQPVVVVQTPLAQPHPAPWWVLGGRVVLVAGAIVALPLHGWALAGVSAAIWLVSAWLVRYPVRLPPGRALFLGGLRNTDAPGRYWLRRRWREQACSIALRPFELDWRPAPTRLEQGERHGWLELELRLEVRPRPDELGQFTALLLLQRWHAHPRTAARDLREQVLGALVEAIERGPGLPEGEGLVAIDEQEMRVTADEGLGRLGLELVQVEQGRMQLRGRTEDLSREDRLWIEAPTPPSP